MPGRKCVAGWKRDSRRKCGRRLPIDARRRSASHEALEDRSHDDLRKIWVLYAAAIGLVNVAKVLIVAAEAGIVRKLPVRRCAARLDADLMVERGRADLRVDRSETGEGSGSYDLINKAGDSGCRGARRAAARIQLQLLLAKIRRRVRVVIVERAIYWNSVVFISDRVGVGAANVYGLRPSLLPLRYEYAGKKRNRGIGVV